MKRRGFIGSLLGCIGIPFIPKETKPPVYTMEIKSINIVGTPRKLKAKWTPDIQNDLMLMMSIDIQKEINCEVVDKLLTSAKQMRY